ncbi:MAG: hypothetical protein K6T91_08710 [Firmicutes bacterium]|nr:hypothetical protein [Bacillota bacterium]
MLFFNILSEAYKLFDRQWRLILLGSALSIGLAAIISVILPLYVHFPSITEMGPDGKPITIDYGSFVSNMIIALADLWLLGFVASIVKNEISSSRAKFFTIARNATIIYPKIILVNMISAMTITISVIAVFPALLMFANSIGIVFLIPAAVFFTWFSLIIPVTVLEEIRGIRSIFARSRTLVQGFFFTIFAMQFSIVFLIPSLVVTDLPSDSNYAEALRFFITALLMILEAVVTVSTYMSVRAAKGEQLINKIEDNSKEVVKETTDI